MPVVFVDCPPRSDLQAAIQKGLQSVGAEDANVRVCGDFAKAVSDFVGQDYQTDRPGGQAGGRTLVAHEESDPVIFLDAKVLDDPGFRPGLSEVEAIERLAAHEAGHVLMLRNREDVTEAEIAELAPVPSLLRQLTAIAIAEYRAERAVRAVGYGNTANSSDRLVPIVVETHQVLTDPTSADPLVLSQKTAPICQSYLVSLAIGAAWNESLGPPELLALFDQGNSTALCNALQGLPPANSSIGNAEFQLIMDNLRSLVVGVVLEVGFEWQESGTQWGFYRRATEDLLNRRLQVAVAWYEGQQAIDSPAPGEQYG